MVSHSDDTLRRMEYYLFLQLEQTVTYARQKRCWTACEGRTTGKVYEQRKKPKGQTASKERTAEETQESDGK